MRVWKNIKLQGTLYTPENILGYEEIPNPRASQEIQISGTRGQTLDIVG